jgi:hypothetical protein
MTGKGQVFKTQTCHDWKQRDKTIQHMLKPYGTFGMFTQRTISYISMHGTAYILLKYDNL